VRPVQGLIKPIALIFGCSGPVRAAGCFIRKRWLPPCQWLRLQDHYGDKCL